MNIYGLTLFLLLALSPYGLANAAEANDYEFWYNLSITQSKQGDFIAAKNSIEKALIIAPDSEDAKLALARYYSWNKQYAEAKNIVDKILVNSPNNIEAQVLEARLFYYQQKYDQAQAILNPIKNNNEAEKLLLDTKSAKNNLATESLKWRLSYGQSQSKFSRVKQNAWRNSFTNLSYKLNRNTNLSVNYEDFRRFNEHNHQISLAADHQFSEIYQGYLAIGNSSNATFLPRWNYKVGGGAQVMKDLRLLLDLQYDDYAIGAVRTGKIGAQYFITKDLALTFKQINIVDAFNKYLHGYYSRLDWNTPFEQLRLYTGYANAPETQNGITINTRSIFGGMAYDINRRMTLYVSYSHDDRKNSFIADTVAGAIAVKF